MVVLEDTVQAVRLVALEVEEHQDTVVMELAVVLVALVLRVKEIMVVMVRLLLMEAEVVVKAAARRCRACRA